MKVEILGREAEISEHAIFRYSMRINPDKNFDPTIVVNGIPVSLKRGYGLGVWNPDENAVFLISSPSTYIITTTIPDRDLEISDKTLEECDCGFLVQPEQDQYRCNYCKEELEPVLEILEPDDQRGEN